MYDLEKPDNFVGSVKNILDKEGIWVLEQSDLGSMINANSYDELSILLRENQSIQEIFSNFMEKVIVKVLNNLNINLPFNRSEIIKKN